MPHSKRLHSAPLKPEARKASVKCSAHHLADMASARKQVHNTSPELGNKGHEFDEEEHRTEPHLGSRKLGITRQPPQRFTKTDTNHRIKRERPNNLGNWRTHTLATGQNALSLHAHAQCRCMHSYSSVFFGTCSHASALMTEPDISSILEWT